MPWPSLWFAASHNTLKVPWSERSPGSLMLPDICDGIGFCFVLFAVLDPLNSSLADKSCCTSVGVFLMSGRVTTGSYSVLPHTVPFSPQIACSSLCTHHQSTRAAPSIENTGIRILVFTSLVANPVMTTEVKTQVAEQPLVR